MAKVKILTTCLGQLRQTEKATFISLIYAVVLVNFLVIILVWEKQDVYPTHSSPKLARKWIITNERNHSVTDLCKNACEKYQDWNVLVLTDNGKSMLFCKDGIPKKITQAFMPDVSKMKYMPMLRACLFAIKKGAEAIYFNPETWMFQNLNRTEFPIKLKKYVTALISKEHTNKFFLHGSKIPVFTSLHHFGCSNSEGGIKSGKAYDLCEHEVPAILAPLSVPKLAENCFPCDKNAPPVTVPENVYVSDLSMGAALYTKRAFWALAFPVLFNELSTPRHIVQVMKYFIQKVVWSTGGRIMLWNNVNSKITTGTMDYSHLDERSIQLVTTLHDISCTKNKVRECLEKCLSFLREEQFIAEEFTEAVEVWFTTLSKQLNIDLYEKAEEDKCISKGITYYSVDYSQNCNKHEAKTSHVPVTNLQHIKSYFRNTCDEKKMPTDVQLNFTHPWAQLSDVLLVVTFNLYHFEVIPYIEMLYRPFFPYILYCGPDVQSPELSRLLGEYKFTFLPYPDTPWGNRGGSFIYECAAIAMSMNYGVVGHAVMSDDVFISVPKFVDYPRDVVWYIDRHSYTKLNLAKIDLNIDWRLKFWHVTYRSSNIALMQAMSEYQGPNSVIRRCYDQLKIQTGSHDRIFEAPSDFYYLPNHLAEYFIQLVWFYRSKQVFLEVAVPTMLECLEEDMVRFNATYLWNTARKHIQVENLKTDAMFHPTKWGRVLQGDVDMLELLCYTALPHLHEKKI